VVVVPPPAAQPEHPEHAHPYSSSTSQGVPRCAKSPHAMPLQVHGAGGGGSAHSQPAQLQRKSLSSIAHSNPPATQSSQVLPPQVLAHCGSVVVVVVVVVVVPPPAAQPEHPEHAHPYSSSTSQGVPRCAKSPHAMPMQVHGAGGEESAHSQPAQLQRKSLSSTAHSHPSATKSSQVLPRHVLAHSPGMSTSSFRSVSVSVAARW